jgi:hypothetical protein
MGMRSGESREGAPRRLRAPRMLLLAAGAQAAEAAGLGAAIVFNVTDAASGRVSTAANAIAFIVFELIIAIGVAWIAWGIAQLRPWSRTPAVMTQAFAVLIAIWLIQAQRYAWGVPALVLAAAALAGLFAPASLRALTRPADAGEVHETQQTRKTTTPPVNRRS